MLTVDSILAIIKKKQDVWSGMAKQERELAKKEIDDMDFSKVNDHLQLAKEYNFAGLVCGDILTELVKQKTGKTKGE